jgi:hypothetical protein
MKSELVFDLPSNVINDLDVIKRLCVRVKLNSPDASSGNSVAQPVPAGAFVSVKMKANLRLKTIL